MAQQNCIRKTRQTWEDSSSWASTDVWCTVTSHAHDPIPHNLITPSSPAEASRPLHSTTALAAPSWPSILRAQVHVPGDHTMIDPSSEQLTTFPLHTHSPLGYEETYVQYHRINNNIDDEIYGDSVQNRYSSLYPALLTWWIQHDQRESVRSAMCQSPIPWWRSPRIPI